MTELEIFVKQALIQDEGFRDYPYIDTLGNITIGLGYNLSNRGLPADLLNSLADNDIQSFYHCLSIDYPWYDEQTKNRQAALIDMAFMGYKKLQEFHNMMQAFADADYELAANEALNSEWAKQVQPSRSARVYQWIKQG